jgi:hypothetical protein
MTYVAIGRIGLVTLGFLIVCIRSTFAGCIEGHCPPDGPRRTLVKLKGITLPA